MKKRLIAVIVAAALLVAGLSTFFIVRTVRNNRAPELSAVRDRIISLVEASHEINRIFWGEGLECYPRVYKENYARVPFYLSKNGEDYVYSAETTDSILYHYQIEDSTYGTVVAYQYCLKVADGEYVDVETGESLTIKDKPKYRYAQKAESGEGTPIFTLDGSSYYALPDYVEKEEEFYYTTDDEEYYDYVKDNVGYLTTDAIKTKAETVYATSFLSSVYESVFTGITAAGGNAGTLQARYIDYEDSEGVGHLMKSNRWQAVDVERVYLFDTMRMSEKKKSKRTDVYVDIDTYVPGKEGEITTVTVAITLQSGVWLLNAATY